MTFARKNFRPAVSIRRFSTLTAFFSLVVVVATSVLGQSAAFAWTTPTTVTFTSNNYAVNAVSNWTFGFSLWSGTGLSNGNVINATFPKGFKVPSSPTVVLGSAFGNHYCKLGSVSVLNANTTTLAPIISVRLSGTGQGNNCAGTYWPGITTWTVDGVTNPSMASSTVTGYTQFNTVEPDPGTVNSPVTIVPTTPGPVASFAATNHANGDSVLTWTPPTNNGGSPITGYSITSSPSVSPPTSCTNTLNLTCTFVGLTNGDFYTFTITPKNAAGAGTSSSTSATPALAPTISTATISSGAPQVGQTLIAGETGVTGAPSPIATFQWFDGANEISGATSSSYVVQTSDYGNLISVKVTETNIAGDSSATSLPTSAVAGIAPTISTATISSGVPQIGQTLIAGETGVTGFPSPIATYQWFDGATEISGATSSSYVVQSSDFGDSITVKVTETNTVGSASAISLPASAVTGFVPGVPTNVIATPDLDVAFGPNSSVTVSWTPPVNGGLPLPITSYTVQYSSNGTNWNTATTSAHGTSYDVTNLTSGTNYLFRVSATNAAGTGLPGESTSYVMPFTVPEAVATPTDSAGNATLTVNWSAPANDGNSPVTEYIVEIWGALYYFPATSATNYTWTFTSDPSNGGISNLTWYHPVVSAVNASGDSLYSDQAPQVFPGFLPLPPTYVLVNQVSSTSVNVYWPFSVYSSGNDGWAIETYTVTVTEGSTTVETIVTPSSHVHLVTATGLTPGTTYEFTVVANAGNGDSGPTSVYFTVS